MGELLIGTISCGIDSYGFWPCSLLFTDQRCLPIVMTQDHALLLAGTMPDIIGQDAAAMYNGLANSGALWSPNAMPTGKGAGEEIVAKNKETWKVMKLGMAGKRQVTLVGSELNPNALSIVNMGRASAYDKIRGVSIDNVLLSSDKQLALHLGFPLGATEFLIDGGGAGDALDLIKRTPLAGKFVSK